MNVFKNFVLELYEMNEIHLELIQNNLWTNRCIFRLYINFETHPTLNLETLQRSYSGRWTEDLQALFRPKNFSFIQCNTCMLKRQPSLMTNFMKFWKMIFLYKDISKNVPKFEKGSKRLRVNSGTHAPTLVWMILRRHPSLGPFHTPGHPPRWVFETVTSKYKESVLAYCKCECKCKPNWRSIAITNRSLVVNCVAMGLPELWMKLGPGLAGAVFGGGWWFWVDAVVCSDIKVSFLHYLPGTKICGPN